MKIARSIGRDIANTYAKLEKLTGARGGVPVWMMSHPKVDDRIAAIEKLEQRWEVAGQS